MPGSRRTRRPHGGTTRFVVVVADPVTDEVDSHGPYSYEVALREAARRREEFDAEELEDVIVCVVPLHPVDDPA
ncbi:hypothetical protein [Actinomycetospora termitidis]|uniref:Uncharacterized protein n=1 Tax=Actinomycetospora termitidis TaxID=3053470 RepID=A0ABT7MG12_9PSEU|nr:hypothetical protein [Actinomycetospora sp. Odt1-22]MDL5159606.1 hypothetical protein [Actinomycetospora sp. Odt1-22]